MIARRARALLTVLRAPLLLSPLADSLAGWTLARWDAGQSWTAQLTELPPAALAGCCLLAAGMAQNALVDQQDDRLRKPDRPLPRGDLSPAFVGLCWGLLTLAALGLCVISPTLWPGVLLIIALSAAYHLLLKVQRLAGCLSLGILRGTSMGLGVLAAGGQWPGGIPLLGCAVYGLYIMGASLHASTDDEPRQGSGSVVGLGLCLAVLLALAGWLTLQLQDPLDLAGPLLLLWALFRLFHGMRTQAPPALTGTALSGLHLLHAGLVAGLGQPLVACLILALFASGRRLLRFFPPS